MSSGDESTTRRKTTRTAPVKRAAAPAKATVTKAAAKKTVKAAPAKSVPAKKTAVKKTAAKSPPAKKTAPAKRTTKAAPAKKSTAKTTAPTKAPAKTATPRKVTKPAPRKAATKVAAPRKAATKSAAKATAPRKTSTKTATKATEPRKTAARTTAPAKVTRPRKSAAPATPAHRASAPTPTVAAARVATSPTESGAAARRDTGGERWQSRPYAGAAVRLVAMAVPIAASIGSAIVLSKLIHRPHGGKVVLWWLAIVVGSTLVLAGVDRFARRLLPLATLLKLSMAFPDQAPSRFSVAARAGTTRGLRDKLARAQQEGIEDEPAQAAERILTLVGALGAHDRRTRGHSERVRAFNDLIAEELRLPQHDRDRLRWAALLHDIGKLHVSPKLLNKPSKPTEKEWAILKSHPARGARIAAPLATWLGEWAPTIEQHHERWDGAGYPNGVSGGDICLGARIVAVADAYEVMTAPRPYSRPVSASAARQELARCAGAQFDPEVVRAFLNVSIGNLRKVIGPISWLAQLPFLGATPRLEVVMGAAGRQVVTAAATATGTGMIAAAMLPHAAHPGHHDGAHRVLIQAAAQSSTGGSTASGQAGSAPSITTHGPAHAPAVSSHRATQHGTTTRSHSTRATTATGTTADSSQTGNTQAPMSTSQRPAGHPVSSQPDTAPTADQPAPSTDGDNGGTGDSGGGSAGGGTATVPGGTGATPPDDTGTSGGSTPPEDTQQPTPTPSPSSDQSGAGQDGDHNGDGHPDNGKGDGGHGEHRAS